MVPIYDVNSIFLADVSKFSGETSEFLNRNKIAINQKEFDALVIYRFNRGSFSQNAIDYLKEGNRNKSDWDSIWTGPPNRRKTCQSLFFGGDYVIVE